MVKEIKSNIGQFIAIFIMAFIAMMTVSGLSAQNNDSFNRYLEDTNYRDLDLQGLVFHYDDMERVGMISGVADVEGWYSTTGTVTLDEKRKLCLSYITDNDISQCIVAEGEAFSAEKSGVWVDALFFNAMNMKVGDVITIESEGISYTEVVRGSVYCPQYVYYMPDTTYVEPVYGEYGFCILGISEYAGEDKYFSQLLVDVEGVTGDLNPDSGGEQIVSRVTADIKNVIDDKGLVVNTKSMDPYVRSYVDSTDGTLAMQYVFPPIFGLIALLGISTTMTKMIAKQRTTIGALKALGIRSSVIHLHYMSYSFFIVLIGCITGAVSGYMIVGDIMIENMVYYYINPYECKVLSPIIFIGGLLLLGASVLVTYLCNRKILAMNTSQILKPEAPKASKASFYESMSLWKRLKFATRWNVRDISNNLGKFIVSMLGIVICSMLLFAAAGFYETLSGQPDWLYKKIITANYNMSFTDSITLGEAEDYAFQYQGQLVEEVIITAQANGSSTKLSLVVTGDGNYYNVTDSDGEYVDYPQSGVMMSYKGAEMLGAELGDYVTFGIDGEKETYTERITKICRSPLTQGIFVSREYWEGKHAQFSPTNLYTGMSIPKSLESRTEVDSVKTIDEYYEGLVNVNAMNISVVALIIVLAILLGSVILYNMGSTSYAEKVGAMATLKVLGFSSGNLREILMQQNIFITVVGALLGLAPGYYAISLLTVTMGEDFDFLIDITAFPYLLSTVGTFLISCIINTLIVRKINTIDMVVALKGE